MTRFTWMRSKDKKSLFRYDILYLLILFLMLGILWSAVIVVGKMGEAGLTAFDKRILLCVRDANDLSSLRGPGWLAEFMRDVTALGGAAVLTLTIIAVAGYLTLKKNYRSAILVVMATLSGFLLSILLKFYFFRVRPDVVPHLMQETTPSFPSGHSMMSAVVYFTVAALLSRVETSNRVRLYTMAAATFIVFLVGISRVFLGVHYPTDILAGWTFGAGWAALCWYYSRYLQEKGVVEESL